MATTKRYDVKDLALAAEGVRRIQWADRQMPVLAAIRERFEREKPLSGCSLSKRSRMSASTGICRSAHSIRRFPSAARAMSFTS